MVPLQSVAFLELTRVIDAPRQLLWHSISTAEGLSTWHADQVTGSLEKRHFRVAWPSLNAQMELVVESVDVEQNKLVFRAGQSLVGLSLVENSVRLIHEGLDETDDLGGFRSSWSLALSLLDHAVTRHPTKPRQVHWFFERAQTTPELVHFYFSNALGLRAWLGHSAADIASVGSKVRLELPNGTRLTGRVLCHEEGRDLAVSWDELDGAALVLRTLPASGGERSLSISLSSYGKDVDPAQLKQLGKCLNRLGETLRGRGSS